MLILDKKDRLNERFNSAARYLEKVKANLIKDTFFFTYQRLKLENNQDI